MHFIPSKVHGVMDYVVGLLLIAAPWLLGFNEGGAETWVPVILGASLIVYSLFTDYEAGLIRAIPLKAHLTLDAISGVFLAVSPWLFNFDEIVWVPHVVVGLLELGSAICTHLVPDDRGVHGHHPAAV